MSPTYNLSVLFFGHGTVEELFNLIKNIQHVIQGQNLMNGPSHYALARHLFQGDAFVAFNLQLWHVATK